MTLRTARVAARGRRWSQRPPRNKKKKTLSPVNCRQEVSMTECSSRNPIHPLLKPHACRACRLLVATRPLYQIALVQFSFQATIVKWRSFGLLLLSSLNVLSSVRLGSVLAARRNLIHFPWSLLSLEFKEQRILMRGGNVVKRAFLVHVNLF